jgi:ABC-type sugar transport system permease subunit
VSLWNTAVYTIASTLPILALPLVLAVALNRGVAMRTVLRSAFFFPFTLSVVTVGLTWLWLLDPVVGPFNYYVKALGLPARSFLADPATAMAAIILTTVWWVTGYYLVIYLAGLQDIPRELYEAAAIDGATGWKSFWAITLPLLKPVLLFVFVTHIIGSFQIFGQVFVLTQGGPGDATRTVVQHLYETAFQNFFQFGAASAMAWVLFALIAVFSLVQFRLLRGHEEY